MHLIIIKHVFIYNIQRNDPYDKGAKWMSTAKKLSILIVIVINSS